MFTLGLLHMDIPGLLRPFSTAGLLLAVMAASTGAHAQGTDEERRACTPDVMRLCREFIPSVSAITQCLIDKRAELNPDCRLVMTPKPDPTRQVAAAATKRTTAKRANARPAAARPQTVSAEPGARPMNIVPAVSKAAPASKKKSRAAKRAHSAANPPGKKSTAQPAEAQTP